jgi:hypothetical protein
MSIAITPATERLPTPCWPASPSTRVIDTKPATCVDQGERDYSFD